MPSKNPMPLPGVALGFVVLKSDDSFEQTVAFYKPLLSNNQDTPTKYVGSTHRSSDGRMTFVSVELQGEVVYIDMSAG